MVGFGGILMSALDGAFRCDDTCALISDFSSCLSGSVLATSAALAGCGGLDGAGSLCFDVRGECSFPSVLEIMAITVSMSSGLGRAGFGFFVGVETPVGRELSACRLLSVLVPSS